MLSSRTKKMLLLPPFANGPTVVVDDNMGIQSNGVGDFYSCPLAGAVVHLCHAIGLG